MAGRLQIYADKADEIHSKIAKAQRESILRLNFHFSLFTYACFFMRHRYSRPVGLASEAALHG